MTHPVESGSWPDRNRPGHSSQRRYEDLFERDLEVRRSKRARRVSVFLVMVVGCASLTFGVIQLANGWFERWQSSLPGQTAGSPRLLSASTALLVTGVATAAMAAAIGKAAWGRSQSTENYRLGAEGERATARRLTPLIEEGFVMLHDRAIPDRQENIDHITVGPTGVAVIETKNWSGRALVSPRALKFNGRDQAAVLAQVARQVAACERVLGDAGVKIEIRPIVCFHRSKIERRGGSTKNPARPKGVRVCGPRQLNEAVTTGPTLLGPDEVRRIAEMFDSALPPAT